MYSTGDLKNLAEYTRSVADDLRKQTPPDEEGRGQLMEFMRQLEAIRFNPILFKTILQRYDVDYSLLERPINEVPLHINDAGILSKTLVQWRCTNGI